MLHVVEFFAGIGSQTQSLKNLGIEHKVVAISEWDVNAIISYDVLHSDDGTDCSKDLSKLQILNELKNFTFSTDGKKPCDLKRVKEKVLRKLYNAHKRSKNMGDITKIQSVPIADLWTYSFPCQDLSVAGKRAGIKVGTRSGLLYEIERLLDFAKEKNELPKYLLLENVKNLVGKEFKGDFNLWLGKLEQLGYNTYWNVLNAKNYGIPQNRERVFAVSIRKDIDDYKFEFPTPFDNGLRLKDFLENDVDEKYYISNEKCEKLLEQLDYENRNKICCDMTVNQPKFKDIGNYITARYDCGISNQKSFGIGVVSPVPEPNVLRYERTEYGKNIRKQYESGEFDEKIGNMREPKPRTDGIANTLSTVQKDNILVVPQISSANESITIPSPELVGGIGEINYGKQYRQGNRVYDSEKTAMCLLSQPVGNTGGNSYLYAVSHMCSDNNELSTNECDCVGKVEGINGHDILKRVYNPDGISPTISTCGGGNTEPKIVLIDDTKSERFGHKIFNSVEYRIRKLTEVECWKLMGFTKEDALKVKKAGVANSQMYKQAGNSIVVKVLENLFKNLFKLK